MPASFSLSSPPPPSASVAAACTRAAALTEWIVDNLPDSFIEVEHQRHSQAFALLSMALGHREAAILLIEHGGRGSAFALGRPAFEALAKGSYFADLASKAQCRTAAETGVLPKMDTVVKDFDKAKDPFFGHASRAQWDALCDYAHGGSTAIHSWLASGEVAPVHSDEEVIKLIRSLDLYAALAVRTFRQIACLDMAAVTTKIHELTQPPKD